MIFFSGSFNKAVSLIAGSANEIYMRESNFGDTLRLNGIEIAEDLDLDKITLPNYLELAQLDVGGLIHLNGTSLNRDMEENKKKCVIELFGIPVDKISFSFENFELYTPDKPDISQFDDYNQIFENLIKKFTASGQLSSLEEVTKQHKRYKYLKDPTQNKYLGMFMNFVNREWNDYGYSKVRIWLWTGGFFIFFWLINWLRFPHIYIHAYSTPSLANAVETRNYNTKAARRNFFNFRALDLSLYYTAIIFFGLKIESANFNFNNRRGVLYIAGQYIVGIICLAYLANFIIVK
ncbi:MAG: hypothetical protein HEP71_10615 [Roseivirga sp.]|nr:hypothetical protein [Roseivirga sp.]